MKEQEIKNIIISLRTRENNGIVDNILGKLDLMPEEQLGKIVKKIGDNEYSLRNYLKDKISNMQESMNDEKYPVNDMFTYGISGNCIHLHMPVDLHQMMRQKGAKATIDTVNLYLLDAIDKIKTLKDNEYYKFKEKDSIYMISPILRLKKEMEFLKDLDFKMHVYKKEDLKNETSRESNEKVKLAYNIFGSNQDVVDAIIGFDILDCDEWKEKKKLKIKEFKDKGITLGNDQNKEEEK